MAAIQYKMSPGSTWTITVVCGGVGSRGGVVAASSGGDIIVSVCVRACVRACVCVCVFDRCSA
jgi:hypothetical protein